MKEILLPEVGYDLVAGDFDQWKWSKLWTLIEEPIVVEWIEQLPAKSIGMNAGGGTGRYLKPILNRSLSCIAVDISQKMLDRAKENFPAIDATRVEWRKADLLKTGLASRSLDWILCARTLTHIQNLELAFHEFDRLLRPGGVCLITDIHPEHNYECTAIPIAAQKIQIQTYKHSLESILAAVGKCPDFKDVELDSVSDSAGNKLLYVLKLQK